MRAAQTDGPSATGRKFSIELDRHWLCCQIRVNGSLTVLPTEVPVGWPLVPDDLSDDGGEFRLLFLSSTKSAATSTDIGTYNTFVQTAAAAGHAAIQDYSDGFRAVVSTAAVDARDNTGTTGNSAPIYWLDGANLADHYRDFYDGTWDDEENPTNESGAAISPGSIWTGSASDGTKGVHDSHGSTVLGGAARGHAAFGSLNSATVDPLSGNTGWREITRNLYAVSEVFTVGPNPAVITDLAITSDPGSDQIYRTGETIEVTATFGAPVTVHGNPRIKLRLGQTEGSHRWAEAEGVADPDAAVPPPELQVSNSGQSFDGLTVLTTHLTKVGQAFTTGPNLGGYVLSSIGLDLYNYGGLSSLGDNLTVTLNAENNGKPAEALCTLSASAGGVGSAEIFAAPAACPTLTPSTTYVVVIERVVFDASLETAIGDTASADEDIGSVSGWSIENSVSQYPTQFPAWTPQQGNSYLIEVSASAAPSSQQEAVPFTYTVADADESDTDGIAVGLDIGTNEVDLNGGSITLAGTELDAVLGFNPLPSDSGHRVNWARPTLVSAATSGDGRRLFLTLSEDLNPDSRPLTSSFTVKRDGATVALRGTTATVSGRAVTLWLAAALTSATQAVTVSYADPSSADDANALQDREGNDALSFSERTVTNRFGPNKVFTGSALIPEGLGVGDRFRLLFLTSTTRDARSSDIDDYNAFVQAAAAGGDDAIRDYSASFLAVASTGAVDARDNTATTGTGVAIYWFGGNKIADNNADFYDGTWDDETNATDESGSAYDDGGAVVFVWTGTDDDGTVLVNPSNIGGGPRGLGVSGAGAAVGFVNSRNDPTMDATRPNPLNSGGVNATNKLFNLYALSEVFLVVDPAAITGVEITSDPGHDRSYATGDEIELALRFGRAVEVSGQPRIKLRLGETESTERWAEHEGGVLVKNTAQIPFSGRALNASSPRLAQQFTTAGGIVDYTLRSIGVRFHTIDNLATAAGQLQRQVARGRQRQPRRGALHAETTRRASARTR